MTTKTVQANGVTSPDNWTLAAGASKAAAVNTPDDDATSYIDSGSSSGTVQTFTCDPALPSGATISQIAVRPRFKRGGGSNANFVVGYSFTKQGGGTQSGESGTFTSTSSWQSSTYTHSGLTANWGSGFTFYVRNTQARSVQISTLDIEITYTALEILPAGLAVGAAIGSARVWSHKIVKTVSAASDDGQESAAGVVLLASGTILIDEGTSGVIGGFIVRALDMPDEAAIDQAHVEVQPYDTIADSPALTIRAQGNPANLTTTTGDFSGRTMTSESADWTANDIGINAYKSSPDIAPVIEEAWAAGSGNGDDLGVFLIDHGGALRILSYDNSPSVAPRLVVVWSFPTEALHIAPSGLAVGLALGAPVVGRGAVNIAPAGKAVGAAFGTAVVGRGAVQIAPAGKAVGVAFGTAKVTQRVVVTGLAVGVGIGSVSVRPIVAPAGLAVAAGIGTATVGRGTVQIAPAGLAVGAAVGAPVVTQAGIAIRPDGLAVAAGIGTAAVGRGAVGIAPAGLAVGATAGAARVNLGLAAEGLFVGASFGTATVSQGVVPIAPAGLAVGASIGTARVWSHRLILPVHDDGIENAAGTMILTSTSLTVNASLPWAALRVVGVEMPAEAVVASARPQLYMNAFDDPRLAAWCELSAAPAALSATAGDISDRTPTGAVALWEADDVGASGYVLGPNFAPAAQQVADLPEWEAGSDLLVVFHDLGEGGYLRCYSVDGGASFRPSIILEWGFGAVALEIGPAGLAVAAAFGEATVAAGAVGIAVEGLAVAAAAGEATVERGAVEVAPEGLAVTIAAGEPAVSGGLLHIEPEGLAVALEIGAPALGHGLAVVGLAVGVALGAPVVGRGAVSIAPAGLVVAAALGAPVVNAGGLLIQPVGLAAAAVFGTATVGRGPVGIAPAGLAVGATLGAAAVRMVITPAGLAVGIGIGAAAVGLVIAPAGQAVGAALGAAVVGRGAVQIAPVGLAVGAAFGTAVVGRGAVQISPAGLAVGAAIGSAAVTISTQFIRPQGVRREIIIGALLVIAATTPASRIYVVPRRRV